MNMLIQLLQITSSAPFLQPDLCQDSSAVRFARSWAQQSKVSSLPGGVAVGQEQPVQSRMNMPTMLIQLLQITSSAPFLQPDLCQDSSAVRFARSWAQQSKVSSLPKFSRGLQQVTVLDTLLKALRVHFSPKRAGCTVTAGFGLTLLRVKKEGC